MPRFALSLHTGGPGGRHFDLLLEHGASLRTWRLRRADFRRPQAARRLPDHRRIYLRYEGPLSGGRGRLRRWDAGTFSPDVDRPGILLAGFAGRKIRTRLLLRARRPRAGTWILSDPTGPLRRTAGRLRRSLRRRRKGLPAGTLRRARRLLDLADRCLQGRPVRLRAVEDAARALPSVPVPRLRDLAAALRRLLRPPS